MLSKSSPIPLYFQLAELIRGQIERGELAPGAQLPSERELSEQADVSRMTARQAVAYLSREGLIETRPGIGTFVAAPKLAHDALHLLGFTEEMARTGADVTSRVLEQHVTMATASVAAELHLTAADEIVEIVRLRQVNGTPVLLETSCLPASLCPGLEAHDLAANSLYALLEEVYGLRLSHARQLFEATIANDYEQEIFGLGAPISMILLRGVTFANTVTSAAPIAECDIPVEYFKAIYRGDRCAFLLESQRRGDASENGQTAHVSVLVD